MTHKPTEAEIDAAMTPEGGWTKAQLAQWGVSWPPPKGWRQALLAPLTEATLFATPPTDRGEVRYWGVPGSFRVMVTEGGANKALDPRLDLARHCIEGFHWGSKWTGCSQLALALLANAMGDDRQALRLHQRFKYRTITGWERDAPWQITRDDILAVVTEIEEAERDPQIVAERRRVDREKPPVATEIGPGVGGSPVVWDSAGEKKPVATTEETDQ